MNEDEMKKFLSENSAEINRAVKEKLIANLIQEHRWQATDQISKAVGEFITAEVLPEVRSFLQSEKGAIVGAAQEAARQIGNQIAGAMTKKAAENIAGYQFRKVMEGIFS